MLLSDLITTSAERTPDASALSQGDRTLSYRELSDAVSHFAGGLIAEGLSRGARVAVYLPKTIETVVALYGTAAAGGVFVPVNPLLKPPQVLHVLADCTPEFLVTSQDRWALLEPQLKASALTVTVILTDGDSDGAVRSFTEISTRAPKPLHRVIDSDVAAILYTSGSTGRPKGVVLSHSNQVIGAQSVASYLGITADDTLLGVLPLSFDYGLNQVSSAFHRGAHVRVMDYLLPRDVIKAVGRYGITGLAGVPPIWNQLARQPWPEEAAASLRYLTNSGGALPVATIEALKARLPRTDIVLMYGLTEAFRSTYLPPSELERRPNSVGKAIPNAEVMVVRPDGTRCAPHEPGELVHRGPLVALGYWNDIEKTSERFKPAPGQPPQLTLPELAVWSGDTLYEDEEGYLYFVARTDAMIKSSGYRISPEEVEEAAYGSGLVTECCAVGVPDEMLGQKVLLLVSGGEELDLDALKRHLKQELPNFMVPQDIQRLDEMPHNSNGKVDRTLLKQRFAS